MTFILSSAPTTINTMEKGGGGQGVVDWSLLPQDISYEILTRVPFETLHSCRKVCALWRRITYEPSFIALHCIRTTTVSGYFIQSLRRNIHSSTFVSFKPLPPSVPVPSLKFLPEDTQILSSTHRGILLCKSPYKHRMSRHYVCKPASKQFRAIPNPRTRFHAKAVAIVASPSGILHFKIVRLSNPTKDIGKLTICEIFDSRTWRWRRYREDLPYLALNSNYPGIEIDNVVHWLVVDSDTIFAFDVIREKWTLIPLPNWLQHEDKVWRDDRLMVGCEGQLCLIRAIRKHHETGRIELEIWTMADYSATQWKRIQWKRIQSERLVDLRAQESVNDFYTRQVVFMISMWESLW